MESPSASMASRAVSIAATGPFASEAERAKRRQSGSISPSSRSHGIACQPLSVWALRTGSYGLGWSHREGSTGCPSIWR